MANRELGYKITLNTRAFMQNATKAFEFLKRKFQADFVSAINQHKFGDTKELYRGIATAIQELRDGLEDAQGIGDVGQTFSRVGVQATRSLVNFLGPYGKIAMVAAAATTALVKLCEQFAEVEKSARSLYNAQNRRSGRMASEEGDKAMQRAGVRGSWLAVTGAADMSDYTAALAEARANGQSIDAGSFDKMAQNAVQYGKLTGRSPEELIADLAPILDATSVTFEELRKVGADLTRQELNLVNALKSVGNQAEANAIILGKLENASSGLGAMFDDSLSESVSRFVNIWQNVIVNLGRILSGPLKLIMYSLNAASALIGGIMEVLGKIFEKIYDFFWFVRSKTQEAVRGSGLYTQTNRDDKKPYVDPRLQISAQFESMDSMTKRIQTSIVSKNSPGERQVGLLQDILRQVEKIHGADRKRQETADQQSAYLHDMNRGIQGFQGGLA